MSPNKILSVNCLGEQREKTWLAREINLFTRAIHADVVEVKEVELSDWRADYPCRGVCTVQRGKACAAL
jgi:hypothetical protein